MRLFVQHQTMLAVAFDLLRDALSAIFGLSELKIQSVRIQKNDGVTYTASASPIRGLIRYMFTSSRMTMSSLKLPSHARGPVRPKHDDEDIVAENFVDVLKQCFQDWKSFVMLNIEQVKLYAFVSITCPGDPYSVRPNLGVLQIGIKSQGYREPVVMSTDSAVIYTSVHSEVRSWSIPSEDPYEEAARHLLEQAPHSPEYVPDPMELEDHVPVYIPEPEHPKDLVPAEDEAPIEAYITEVASAPPPPPSFLPSLIRPLCTRAAMAQMRAAEPSTYHPLLPSRTLSLLPISLPAPSTSRRANIPEADMPPLKRLLLTAPRPGSVDTVETRVRDTERRMMAALEVVNLRVSYQVDVRSRESSEFYSRHHDAQKDRAVVRAEIEVLRRERLAYEQESMETRQALARSEAYSRALEAQVTVIETQARRHEWQCQDADDRAMRHIMRIQALEAGARDDTLEDTGSSA
ncbi:hypothetical protein Tco_1194467 [Tanacetum coccineum]